MTAEERLQMEVKSLREKVKELQDKQVGIDKARIYLQNRVALGLGFAIPKLNAQTALSVVKVMTFKELTEFARALEESEVKKDDMLL